MWALRTPAERETPLPLKFNLGPGRMLTRRLKRKPIINQSCDRSAKMSPVFLTKPMRGNTFVTVRAFSSADKAAIASSAKT
jgi:hypothetical protein